MNTLLLLALCFCLGGTAFLPLTWLLGYRERMRRQRVEAMRNRLIGAIPRKTMRLPQPVSSQSAADTAAGLRLARSRGES